MKDVLIIGTLLAGVVAWAHLSKADDCQDCGSVVYQTAPAAFKPVSLPPAVPVQAIPVVRGYMDPLDPAKTLPRAAQPAPDAKIILIDRANADAVEEIAALKKLVRELESQCQGAPPKR